MTNYKTKNGISLGVISKPRLTKTKIIDKQIEGYKKSIKAIEKEIERLERSKDEYSN